MKKFFLFFVVFFNMVNTYAKDLEFTIMHNHGGVSDIVSRFIVNEMNSSYVPLNRPGASGQIAIKHLLDRETVMLATMIQVFVTNPLNHKTLNYNPETDLELLATIGIMPSALVCHAKTQLKTYSDFKNFNKKITFGVGGYGSSEHIATETLLIKNQNINGKIIPYAQGGNTSVKDLLGAHIDCMFANFPTIKPHLENKDIILLMTSHELNLNVPTWESLYKNQFPFQSYLSIIISKKMEDEKKLKIKKDLEKSFLKTDYNEKLKSLGIFPIPSTNNINLEKSLKEMEVIKNFILTNNIKTIEK